MVATIDLYASRTAIGGGGGEQSAPIDDLFDGLSCSGGSGRCQLLGRLWSPVTAGDGAGLGPAPAQASWTAG